MRMLTIHHHQSDDESDFCWGIEGEIAVPIPWPLVCDRLACGCDRSHTGLNSHRASTTLMIRHIDLSLDDLVIACIGTLETAGWLDVICTPHEVAAEARELITDSADTAAQRPAGTVLRMAFCREHEQWATPRRDIAAGAYGDQISRIRGQADPAAVPPRVRALKIR